MAKWGGYTSDAEGNIFAGSGIGVDDDDNIYVSDRVLNRVQKFDRDGNFLLMWGGGVATSADEFEICTSNCQAGSFGGGQGRFKQAEGIDVDTSVNVYVVDSIKDRVQQYDTGGNFIAVWGGSGSSEGEFVDPTQLTVSDDGLTIYVADTGNHRI